MAALTRPHLAPLDYLPFRNEFFAGLDHERLLNARLCGKSVGGLGEAYFDKLLRRASDELPPTVQEN